MADKKIQMKLRNAENTAWDNLYPIPDLTDYVRQPGFGTTAGEANTYTVGTTPAPAALVDGMGIYLKINVTNTGASTLNWDSLGAIAIKDSKGNALTAGKLTAGAVIGVKYNSTTANFILLGEGGAGSAVAGDLLFGKTATVDSGDITGTMPNNGALGNITPTTSNQNIPAGYTSGGTVLGDADLVSGNIKDGVTVFGVEGTCPGFTLVAGVGYVLNLDTKRQALGTSYSKAKEVEVNFTGSVKVYFELLPKNNSNSFAYGRIYINGNAVGIQRSVGYDIYPNSASFTEDFNVSNGDLIQLYIKGGGATMGECQNFRLGISYDIGDIIQD